VQGPGLSLILGGASSGKSGIAERAVLAMGGRAVYLATASAGDDEMRRKIDRHRARRDSRWETIEEPLEVAQVIESQAADRTVLLECLTFWLLNQLEAGRSIQREQARLADSLGSARCRIVVVSNETGLGIMPSGEFARRFGSLQGELNQQIAGLARNVALVVAGLPVTLKGRIPG